MHVIVICKFHEDPTKNGATLITKVIMAVFFFCFFLFCFFFLIIKGM